MTVAGIQATVILMNNFMSLEELVTEARKRVDKYSYQLDRMKNDREMRFNERFAVHAAWFDELSEREVREQYEWAFGIGAKRADKETMVRAVAKKFAETEAEVSELDKEISNVPLLVGLMDQILKSVDGTGEPVVWTEDLLVSHPSQALEFLNDSGSDSTDDSTDDSNAMPLWIRALGLWLVGEMSLAAACKLVECTNTTPTCLDEVAYAEISKKLSGMLPPGF